MVMNSNKNTWVCVDFGTCNTAAAIEIDGKPHVVSYANSQFFPTVACVMPTGKIKVCQEAEGLRNSMPDSFFQEFKLQIADFLDFNGVQYVDIVAEILSFVRTCAETENNNLPINAVLLTIPVLYGNDDPRIEVMEKAAFKAGFEKVEFLSESKAACLHYSHVTGKKNIGRSLIYDLGGSTFDTSIIGIDDKGSLEILGSDGGIKCGGSFFDKAIYKRVCQILNEKDKPLDKFKKNEDYAVCKRIKEILSVRESTSQVVSNGERIEVGRTEFEKLIKNQILLTFEASDSVVRSANVEWSGINQVLLVGGPTAIPCISEMLKKHLVSHNAPNVKIIRNTIGPKGEYNYRFATCLGGISSKIQPPKPPKEPVGHLNVNGKVLQLKEGVNTFGRDGSMDFVFDDVYMSRKPFTITVTRDVKSRCHYNLTTCSETRSTIVNNLDVLDLSSFPLTKKSVLLQDEWFIVAGKTKLIFKRAKISSNEN